MSATWSALRGSVNRLLVAGSYPLGAAEEALEQMLRSVRSDLDPQ
jgi:hypothetical protein